MTQTSIELAAERVWRGDQPPIHELARFLKIYTDIKVVNDKAPRVGSKVIKASNGDIYTITWISSNGAELGLKDQNGNLKSCTIQLYYEDFLEA